MAIFIKLRQDKMGSNKADHKYNAHVVSTGEVSTAELAMLIQEKTSFTRADVNGMISAIVDEMTQQLSDGKTVVLDGLGRFHLSVESRGAATPDDFDIARDIKRVKCKFLAAGNRLGGRNGNVIQLFGKDVHVEWYPDGE